MRGDDGVAVAPTGYGQATPKPREASVQRGMNRQRFVVATARRGLHGLLPHRRARALDARVFDRVARARIPLGDQVLPRLSSLANHSVLWGIVAAALFSSGKRRARRAALRGLVSVGLTSAIVNLPMKLAFRRARPSLDAVPVVRHVARIPVTSSFPSGHSASAFAFAVGASKELPQLAPVLVPVASLVGFSRVYVGVHFPGDVLVGAAMGAAIAGATTRFWPIPPHGDPPTAKAWLPDFAEPSASGKGLVVVANAGAGLPFTQPLDDLKEALPDVEVVEIEEGADLVAALEDAAKEAVALGVCGGDGSVNAAAKVALEAEKPLLVIPGGTLNHLAHAIGVDSVDASIAAVRRGEVVGVDVATIDGHEFLNTASFGSYVELVDARERLEDRIGKWPAVVVALLQVLRRSEPVEVEMDGERLRTWMVFIGNCRYHPGGFAPSWRERLDDELLDVRYVDATPPWSRARLIGAILTGRLGRSHLYKQRLIKRLEVRSLQGPLRLARDGETFEGSEEFVVTKMPKRIGIYAPHHAE